MHYVTVDRTTNGSGTVSELTLEEIKRLDAGSWKSSQFEGEEVPTLEEVLQ
ncbi:MAG TPA: glycerophosphodiester phosphodiesterase, partial [bacterium]|nr:glycerophosphodiester phosphodiesterase [bacterium]